MPDLIFAGSLFHAGLALLLGAVVVLWRAERRARLRMIAAQAQDQSISMLFEGDRLLDASPAARALLGPTPDPQSGWDQAARIFAPLFPGFPARPVDLRDDLDGGLLRLAPGTAGHIQPLCLTAMGGRVRLDLAPEHARHADADLLRQIEEMPTLRRAADQSPLAVWQTGRGQRITWANGTYLRLAQRLMPDFPAARGIAPLFAPADLDPTKVTPQRVSLALPGGGLRWFNVTTARSGDNVLHYALCIDDVVQAETAQRNFVQTLTKTFATLSIGLAIFDRDRRLALFNPALIDLTALPADFLSSRPTLSAVFDRMRDSQTMPEPRDYASWRHRMAQLVAAAADGKFLETWVLPGGQTYRVTGRPHPDGAIAFVFEDISAEMTLTRRFRSELGLGRAVLNQLPEAIAVFSPTGVLILSNTAYGTLWRANPDLAFSDTTVTDALRHWQADSATDVDWTAVQAFLTKTGTAPPALLITKTDGAQVMCHAAALPGGSAMVVFATTAKDPAPKASHPALAFVP